MSVTTRRVLSVLADGERSVEEISLEAGLTLKQVKDVLYRLFDEGRVQAQMDNDVEFWRLG